MTGNEAVVYTSLAELSKDGEYDNVPSSDLSKSAISVIGKFLQSTEPECRSSSGRLQSWIGVAELMDIDNRDVNNLMEIRAKVNCFQEIFDKWTKHSGSTVGALISYLTELEIYDVLEDETVIKLVKVDVEKAQERKRRKEEAEAKVAASKASGPSALYQNPSEEITVGDVLNGVKTQYDAYVSYVESDMEFVKEMITNLEGSNFGLKLCVDARDLLAGQSQLTVTAKLIRERCRKVVVVVSKEFLKSEINIFQVRFAHALSPASVSKRLIPIFLDVEMKKSILSEIQFISKLPYRPDSNSDWFWNRLICSVKSSSEEIQELEGDEIERGLSDIQISTDHIPVMDRSFIHPPCDDSLSSDVDEGIGMLSVGDSISMPSLPSLCQEQGVNHSQTNCGTIVGASSTDGIEQGSSDSDDATEGAIGGPDTSVSPSVDFVPRQPSSGSPKQEDMIKLGKKSLSFTDIFSSLKKHITPKNKSKSKSKSKCAEMH